MTTSLQNALREAEALTEAAEALASAARRFAELTTLEDTNGQRSERGRTADQTLALALELRASARLTERARRRALSAD